MFGCLLSFNADCPTDVYYSTTHVMNVMASWLPVDLTMSTEVCFVKGGVEGNKKTDWLGQLCFWAKLSGVQRRGDSNGPLFKIPKLPLEDAQLQQYHLPHNYGMSELLNTNYRQAIIPIGSHALP